MELSTEIERGSVVGWERSSGWTVGTVLRIFTPEDSIHEVGMAQVELPHSNVPALVAVHNLRLVDPSTGEPEA